MRERRRNYVVQSTNLLEIKPTKAELAEAKRVADLLNQFNNHFGHRLWNGDYKSRCDEEGHGYTVVYLKKYGYILLSGSHIPFTFTKQAIDKYLLLDCVTQIDRYEFITDVDIFINYILYISDTDYVYEDVYEVLEEKSASEVQ
jgi:hypothetical protein